MNFAAQKAFHKSLRAVAPAQVHAVGAEVKVDDWFGVVVSFDADEVVLGNRGFYQVRVTGGKTIMGKLALVGEVRRVLHSNVKA